MLGGGDPDRMTLRRFIDVAYTILVEEYQRLGIDLLTAIEKVSACGVPEAEQAVVQEAERVDNDQSMNTLMAMMAGVKGAPV